MRCVCVCVCDTQLCLTGIAGDQACLCPPPPPPPQRSTTWLVPSKEKKKTREKETTFHPIEKTMRPFFPFNLSVGGELTNPYHRLVRQCATWAHRLIHIDSFTSSAERAGALHTDAALVPTFSLHSRRVTQYSESHKGLPSRSQRSTPPDPPLGKSVEAKFQPVSLLNGASQWQHPVLHL